MQLLEEDLKGGEVCLHIYTIHSSINRPKTEQDELTRHKTLFQNLVTYLIDILGMKKMLSSLAKPFKNTDQSELSTAGHQELLACSLVSLLL